MSVPLKFKFALSILVQNARIIEASCKVAANAAALGEAAESITSKLENCFSLRHEEFRHRACFMYENS